MLLVKKHLPSLPRPVAFLEYLREVKTKQNMFITWLYHLPSVFLSVNGDGRTILAKLLPGNELNMPETTGEESQVKFDGSDFVTCQLGDLDHLLMLTSFSCKWHTVHGSEWALSRG